MRWAASFLAAAAWCAGPSNGPVALHIPYWVTDGEPAAAVSAKVNGQPAAVVRTRGADHDMVLLIVLDLAGDLALVDPARQALTAAIDALPANVYVGLLRAQDGLRVLVDPGPDRSKIKETIDGLSISGRAGLLDTVETAAQVADSMLAKANVRTALLYVTDSAITNYREDYTNPVVNSNDSRDMSRRFPEGLVKEKLSRIAAGLSPRQTPLFIVHLRYQNDRVSEAYQSGLLELASSLAGSAVFCRTVAEVPAAIEHTFATMKSLRNVELQVSASKAREAEVDLSAEGGSLRWRQRVALRK